ncbi:MAG: hypothetical protein RR523_12270 [Cetobacterium sp.]|uniref:hypothetical protein n=1 Tax=Cetobacterium sp. TaxID=2071632 RepID=UPI002FC9080A
MSDITKFFIQIILTIITILILIYGKEILPLKLRNYLFMIKNNKKFFKYLKIKNPNREKTLDELKSSECLLAKIKMFDIFSNKEMNNLIKSIYGLNKKKYKLKNLYLRNKKFGNIDYIDSTNGFYSTKNIVKITPKKDLHIRSIEISCKQVNNQEFIVEFEFTLLAKYENIFINNHYKLGKKFPFIEFYYDDIDFRDKALQDFWISLYQAYLNKILKLNYGKRYILPRVCFISDKNLNLEEVHRDFITLTYIDLQNKSVTYRELDDNSSPTFYSCFKKEVPKVIEINEIDSKLYYTLFYPIEKMEIKRRLNKYFNSQKNITHKNFIWLINKLRNFDEYRRYEKNLNLETYNKYKYIYYENDEKIVDSFSQEHYKSLLEEEYRGIYNYLEKIYSQQKERRTINLAFGAIILTIITTFYEKIIKLISSFN